VRGKSGKSDFYASIMTALFAERKEYSFDTNDICERIKEDTSSSKINIKKANAMAG
jgi:hypothetical protein